MLKSMGGLPKAPPALDSWDDPFDVDLLDNYRRTQGTFRGGLYVKASKLKTSDAMDHLMVHRSLRVVDNRQLLKVVPGPTTYGLVSILLKYIDDANWLMYQHAAYDNNASLYTTVNGSTVQAVFMNEGARAGGDPFWMVSRIIGSEVKCECYDTDPHSANAALRVSMSYTLPSAGNVAATLGAGVKGYPGFRLIGFNGAAVAQTDWGFDDWTVAPNVRNTDRSAF